MEDWCGCFILEYPFHGRTATVKEIRRMNEQTDIDLPMVIWLTGAEDYFKDFNLDSDAAMNYLGIKRSRLNQISGRELRVGKARFERYIRPVYREKDVEEYLSWVRPPASHKKASTVLDEARKQLEDKTDKLEDKLSSHWNDTAGKLESFFKQKLNWHQTLFQKSGKDLAELIQQEASNTQNKIANSYHLFAKFQKTLSQQVQNIYEKLEDKTDHLKILHFLDRNQNSLQNTLQTQLIEQTNELKALILSCKESKESNEKEVFSTYKRAKIAYKPNFNKNSSQDFSKLHVAINPLPKYLPYRKSKLKFATKKVLPLE